MAADIGADVDRPEFALGQFDRGKNRALRTAGAEIRRPRRNIVERRKRAGAMRTNVFDAARNGFGIEAARLRRRNEARDTAQQHLRRIVAVCGQAALAVNARVHPAAAQNYVDLLFDVIGRTLLHDQDGTFAGAEFPHVFRHKRISDVEHIDRDARGAVEISKIEPRQSAQQTIGQSAENDNADFADLTGNQLVELLLTNELVRRRQALFDFQPLLREGRGWMRKPAIFEPDWSR